MVCMAQAEIYRKTLAESMKNLLEKETIDRITVEEVCEKADISRRSFYRYFIDKYDVVSWIVDQEFFDKIDLAEDETLWDVYPGFLRYLYENRTWFLNALSFTGQNSLRQHLYRRGFPIICHDFKIDFPGEYWRELAVRKYFEMAVDSYVWWLEEKDPLTPEEMMNLTISVIKPLVSNIALSFQRYEKNHEN